MRGEYVIGAGIPPVNRELPPRARRIHCMLRKKHIPQGTTSACAENTSVAAIISSVERNYLRVRGEYTDPSIHGINRGELPPRARRIPAEVAADPRSLGTTSACAENTQSWQQSCPPVQNYLRVRGEYPTRVECHRACQELPPRARRIRDGDALPSRRWELPPRARRILTESTAVLATKGTTSACAENTPRTIAGA